MDVSIALTLGVIASLIAQLVWSVYAFKIPIIRRFSQYSISGVYATRFTTDVADGDFIELVLLRQNGDKINLYMENYNSGRATIWKYGGKGIIRSSQIAITYYPQQKTKPNVGVFSLRSMSTESGDLLLSGLFTQLIDRPGKDLHTFSQKYYLRRISIPFLRQLRILFHHTYFNSYSEVQEYFQSQGILEDLIYNEKDSSKFIYSE